MKKDDNQNHRTVVVEVDAAPTGLSAEEERVLRMRSGAGLARDARLGSKLDGVNPAARADVEARLRLIEATLLGVLDDDDDPDAEGEPGPRSGPPLDAARKLRIVAALRGKPEG